MNLPNILTISRIFLAFGVILLLEEGSATGNILAAIVFAIASLTDFCDGHLAKKKGLVSDFGKIMDPIADKVLILSTFGVFAHMGVISWWMFIVIAIREIMVTASRLMAMRHGHVLAADTSGKIKTVTQIIAVSIVLFYLIAQQCTQGASWFYHVQRIWLGANYVFMLIAVMMTIYSGVEYFYNKSKIGQGQR